MAFSTYQGVFIKGIVNVIPSTIEDNLEFSLISLEDRLKLVEHTGIRFRRIVNNNNHTVKYLFQKGCEELLNKLGWESHSVHLLICVTQTSIQTIPSIACQLHEELKLAADALCFDMNLGCSGYTYGLNTIISLLKSIEGKKVRAILCSGDISSILIDSNDKATKPIFSDAVSVTGIELDKQDEFISAFFNLQTIGSGSKAIYTEMNNNQQPVMKLNGIDVFNYSVRYVPSNILELFNYAKMQQNMSAAFIFHQANQIINNVLIKKLNLDHSVVPSTLHEYGNTSSASIPITLTKFIQMNNPQNQWVLISGFGVGFSLASALIFISKNIYCKTLEL